MDFVQTTLDGESVKIINVTGSEKNTSIAYIDSGNNLKVKVKPVDWSLTQNLSTSSVSTGANVTSGGNYVFSGKIISPKMSAGIKIHKTHHGDASGESFVISGLHTSMEQRQAFGDFYGFRVWLTNWSTSSVTLGQSIYTLPSTRQSTGQGATFYNITYGGQTSSITIPASVSGDSINPLSTIPGLIASDPVYVKNVARVDGGIGPFVEFRHLWPVYSRPGLGGPNGTYDIYRAFTGVDEVAGYSPGNDRVTSNPGNYGMTMVSSGAPWHWSFVEFFYINKSISLVSFGDSTMIGYGSSAGNCAGVDMCSKFGRNDGLQTIISPAKFGGKTALGTLNTVKSTISAGINIDYAVIPSWTINDGKTDAAFDAGLGCAIEMIQRCKNANITPILVTPRLCNSLSGTQVTKWVEIKNKVLSMQNDVLVCDYTKNIEDPNSPGHFLEGFVIADGIHPNDAGYANDGRNLYNLLLNNKLVN